MNALSEEKNTSDEVCAVISVHGGCSVNGISLIVLFCLLLPGIAGSQLRPLQTITYVSEFTASADYAHHTAMEYSDRKRSDLLVYDTKRLSLNILIGDQQGSFSDVVEVATVSPPTSVTVGRINADSRDDIVVVLRELNKIIVYMSNEFDSSYRSVTMPVNYYPEHAVIGDLNGDRFPDILTYGRLSSGVSVILGKGRDALAESRTIFSSIPIDGIEIINLNADRIPDLAIRKWLSNEDSFYFGLGNLQYSEQTTLSYGTDSTVAGFADLNGDNITDVIVASSQMNSVLVYHGDGLGNWIRVQNITCQAPIGAMTISAIHAQGIPDILVRSAGMNQLSVIVNKNNGYFYDEIVFGVPYEGSAISVADLDRDGNNEIMVFDRTSRRYSVFWNSRSMLGKDIGKNIAVGSAPTNISLVDLNGDGYDDIVVNNSASNTLSMLMGSADGSLAHFSVETADAPTQAMVYSRSDSGITFLTVHADKSSIGVMTMNAATSEGTFVFRDVDLSTIPLSGTPSSVLPDLSHDHDNISLYVFSKSVPNGIIFYRQILATKFVAKSLTLQVPSRIIFATIGEVNKDGITDLVYVYNDKKTKKDILGTTLNDSEGNFTGKSFSFVLPDTGLIKAFLYVEDVNGDQNKDVVMVDQSRKRLQVILGNEDGSYSSRIPVVETVDINDLSQLQVIDYDMDGIQDIVFYRSDRRSIFLLKGKGNGSFFPGVSILDGFPASSFRCGDVNGDGRIDIVYTVPRENAMRIYYGK
jgi:hypothetical protein